MLRAYVPWVLELCAGLGLIAATLLGSQRFELLDLHRFLLCWIGVLIALDGLARWLRGSSPLATPRDWAACALCSVVFWDVFELVDLRLKNWWYTGISPSPLQSALFGGLCFATVLPAVRLGLHALGGPGGAPGPLRLKPRTLFALGAGSLALALAFPRVAYPLAWLFLWPLCEALASRFPARELPTPLEAQDARLWLRLLALGLPLGLTWEALNWGCARGWVYTVPGFESPKLFEMPLPGYLGYLPFLLEAGAALALLDRVLPLLKGSRGALAAAAVVTFHFAIDPSARARTDLSYEARGCKGAQDALCAVENATHMGLERARRYQALGISGLDALARADWKDLSRKSGDDPAVVRLFIEKARR